MRAFLLALAVLALPLTGCDSGGDGNDDDGGNADVNCQAVGLLDGSLGGSATTGSVSANCFSIDTSGGLTLIAFDVPSLSVVPRTTLLISLDDTALGTYALGDGNSRVFAQYTPSGTSGFDAASGSFTLTEFSATRVRGTFDFTTVNEIEVSGGSLSVTL